MNKSLAFLLFPQLFTLFQAVHADQTRQPSQIEVFFDRQTPITGIKAIKQQGFALTMYDLSAPESLTKTLSQGLPADEAQAKTIVQERLNQTGHHHLRQRFTEALQGIVKSLEYQLDRYPAIVFDQGQSVVYGVNDCSQALDHYYRWRANHE